MVARYNMEEVVAAPNVGAMAPFPASVALQRVHEEAPAGHFTLGWLLAGLSKHSFGIILLLLSIIAIAPGVSIVAGALIFIPAFEMIAGRSSPVFPRRLAAYPLSTPQLSAVVQRAIPVLRYLEKVIHPRWPTPPEPTKRFVGVVVAILSTSLVFLPIPLSGVVPAMAIGLIALAYLEEDGLLLLIGLVVAIIVLAVELAAVWAMVLGAKWIVGL
jgi:hypothetical protein